jgi:hypothetical protein
MAALYASIGAALPRLSGPSEKLSASEAHNMQRRHLIAAATAALSPLARANGFAPARPLSPVRAAADRIVDIVVGLRPFRAQGPRVEAERVHGKWVIHHYGHGGSGWSLSWGSAQRALALLPPGGPRQIAVIGAGAIGLTTARIAQMAGHRVRIYAKDRPPRVHSGAATGLWTPDSRICTEEHATPAWSDAWEATARASFKMHQSWLGAPASPVEWHDGYLLSDLPFDQGSFGHVNEPDYPDLAPRVADLRPQSQPLGAGQHPFAAPHVRRFTQVVFNIGNYQRQLLDDFARDGGVLVQREFSSPRELARLPERVIFNCTGIGAKALFGDGSLVPVRGQTARLIPQPEVDYALIYRGRNLVMVPRRDGLLVQANGEHDFGSADLTLDRAQTVAAVERLAALFT